MSDLAGFISNPPRVVRTVRAIFFIITICDQPPAVTKADLETVLFHSRTQQENLEVREEDCCLGGIWVNHVLINVYDKRSAHASYVLPNSSHWNCKKGARRQQLTPVPGRKWRS
jgi:hypothetical protein